MSVAPDQLIDKMNTVIDGTITPETTQYIDLQKKNVEIYKVWDIAMKRNQALNDQISALNKTNEGLLQQINNINDFKINFLINSMNFDNFKTYTQKLDDTYFALKTANRQLNAASQPIGLSVTIIPDTNLADLNVIYQNLMTAIKPPPPPTTQPSGLGQVSNTVNIVSSGLSSVF